MVLCLAAFEGFKRDVIVDILPVTSSANTIRRKFIDIAGKIISSSGSITLKLRDVVLERLSFSEIWIKSNYPPLLI